MQSISDIVRASKLKSGYNARLHADVAKLVDAPDLGSGVAIREGSSPFIRTTPLVPLVYRFWGGPVLPSPRQSSFILV